MSWQRVPVLVTGAAGFIGSHLVRRLVSEGAAVNVLLKNDVSRWRLKDLLDQVTVWESDITDLASLQNIFSNFQPRVVFHLAAHVDVTRSWDLVSPLVQHNIIGTINLLTALKDTKFTSFVYTGSSEEYGTMPPPLKETQREAPISPYSFSKLSGTLFCQMAARTFDLPVTVLRLFPTYGPSQEGAMFIPSAIREFLAGREFCMTHGEQRKDFMYVDDVVEAFLRVAACAKARGEVFNVGTGVPRKVGDVIDIITKHMGTECKVLRGAIPCRKGEGDECYSNNQKLLDVIGWAPKVSLEEGLPVTVAWYKKHYAQ